MVIWGVNQQTQELAVLGWVVHLSPQCWGQGGEEEERNDKMGRKRKRETKSITWVLAVSIAANLALWLQLHINQRTQSLLRLFFLNNCLYVCPEF